MSKRTLHDFWFKKEQSAVPSTNKGKHMVMEINLLIFLLIIVPVNT